jgi:hypothetical protein
VTEATLEIPISRELQGIQTAFYALPNVNAILPQVTSSRNLPINLDPESPEGSPVVADVSSLEPLHDGTGLFVPQYASRHAAQTAKYVYVERYTSHIGSC